MRSGSRAPRALTLANAGMPLPILVRKGQCRAIRAEGVPLGLLEHTEYQPVTVNLETGDLLAFFSDGITEANNPQQEEFGSRRLESISAPECPEAAAGNRQPGV